MTILRVRVDLSSFFFTVQISNEKILLYICTRFTRCLDDIRFIWIIIVSINITDKIFLELKENVQKSCVIGDFIQVTHCR